MLSKASMLRFAASVGFLLMASVACGTVEWDERAIKIDGERVLLNVGHVHYPRSTPSMWKHILDRSVEAGINAIDTYVFWNYHEINENQYDFSMLTKFLQVIQEYPGLYVILRIGPYVCAEWNYGVLNTYSYF
jgi:beta-galactosidase GanA